MVFEYQADGSRVDSIRYLAVNPIGQFGHPHLAVLNQYALGTKSHVSSAALAVHSFTSTVMIVSRNAEP